MSGFEQGDRYRLKQLYDTIRVGHIQLGFTESEEILEMLDRISTFAEYSGGSDVEDTGERMGPDREERIKSCVADVYDVYQEKSGELLVSYFPETSSGDEDFGEVAQMLKDIDRNVRAWVDTNVDPGSEANYQPGGIDRVVKALDSAPTSKSTMKRVAVIKKD